MKRLLARLLLVLAPLGLAGCDLLGIESASDIAAKRDAEGKAIGGACRYSARPIEECFALNKRADKAAMFAGWREMNDYMRDNKIDAMPAEAAASGSEGGATAAADPPTDGAAAKPAEPDTKASAKAR